MDKRCILIDNGSGFMKGGFTGDEAPLAVIPSVTGRPLRDLALTGLSPKELYFGDEAHAFSGVLNIKSPIDRGIVRDWSLLEKLWNQVFSCELRVEPS